MDGKVRKFQDLIVWQKAHALALAVYSDTRLFPREEIYGMTSQIRRASVSITCNIAEGSKRQTTKDLCHFINMAQSSTEEVKCLILLAKDLKYLTEETSTRLYAQTDEIAAMLYSLVQSLR